MPRSHMQSDFSVVRTPDPALVVVLPDSAGPVALPRAQVQTTEASAFATRWIMRATFVLFLALFLLCAVGLHIPSGE